MTSYYDQYDVFGDPVELVPTQQPAKVEILLPGPTHKQQFEAMRRAVVNAEDDEYAAGKMHRPFKRDLADWMISALGMHLDLARRHIEELTPTERLRYQDALTGLSRSVRNLQAAIDQQREAA